MNPNQEIKLKTTVSVFAWSVRLAVATLAPTKPAPPWETLTRKSKNPADYSSSWHRLQRHEFWLVRVGVWCHFWRAHASRQEGAQRKIKYRENHQPFQLLKWRASFKSLFSIWNQNWDIPTLQTKVALQTENNSSNKHNISHEPTAFKSTVYYLWVRGKKVFSLYVKISNQKCLWKSVSEPRAKSSSTLVKKETKGNSHGRPCCHCSLNTTWTPTIMLGVDTWSICLYRSSMETKNKEQR